MAHTRRCAEAKGPRCTCTCGGASHGCQGAFKIADGAADGVRTYEAEREREWDALPEGMTCGRAAIGCAQADVVRWLHRDRELLKCARLVQETALEDDPNAPDRGMVLRRVAEHLGQHGMQEFQEWAREKHFWCELLAQMAHAVAQYEKLRGRIFEMMENVISQSAEPSLPEGLLRGGAIGSAVRWAWRYVLASVVAASGIGSLATLLASGDLQPLLWPIRVIAVLMCPDASRHPAVRKYCWEPIVRHGSAEIREVVRERLSQVFPENPGFALGGNAPA